MSSWRHCIELFTSLFLLLKKKRERANVSTRSSNYSCKKSIFVKLHINYTELCTYQLFLIIITSMSRRLYRIHNSYDSGIVIVIKDEAVYMIILMYSK